MTMPEAIKACFSQYATFRGRASRSEYWYFALFYVIVSFGAGVLDGIFNTILFAAVALLVFLLPSLAVGVRRLHDTGRSGWWLLLNFVPLVGTIVLLVWLTKRTEWNDNRYGPPPGTAPPIPSAA